jgi:hypothetical protein
VAAKGLSGANEFAYVCDALRKLPADVREPCEYLYFQGHSIGISRVEAKYTVQAQQGKRETRHFWSSVSLLLLIVGISVFKPEPSPWQMTVFRLVMALSAGGLVAYLPGMLTIQGTLPASSFLNNAKLRASGSFAVFVLVYYYGPTIMKH